MPNVTTNSHVERLGIAELTRICAQAHQIFREVHFRDVGIDGFIEIVLNGEATGVLVGVQIKSGTSYVSENKERFLFPTDRAHLLYWAGCAFPVIGVIYDPSSGRTAWFDITAECTEERIEHGPFVLSVRMDGTSRLTPATLISQTLVAAINHVARQSERTQVHARIDRYKATWARKLPARRPSTPEEAHAGWRQLVEYMMSASTSIAEAADVAYRLSWYMPNADDPRRETLLRVLNDCPDHQLVRLLLAADHANEIAGEYAEHVVSIISMIPSADSRIESMIRQSMLPKKATSVAIMALEHIQERERPDLWKLIAPD